MRRIWVIGPRSGQRVRGEEVVALCGALVERGHPVSLIVEGGNWLEPLHDMPRVRVHPMPGIFAPLPHQQVQAGRELYRLLSEEVPALLNLQVLSPLPLFSTVGRVVPVPVRVCLSLHAQEPARAFQLLGRTLERLVLDVSTESEDQRRALWELGMSMELGTVVYPGISAEWLLPVDAIESRAARVASEPLRAGVIARLDRHSGLETLLEAQQSLMEQGRPLQVEVAGEGPLWGNLVSETRRRGLADSVRFLGPVSDLRTFLDRQDLMLSTADQTSIPRDALWAMARGVPVLAAAVNGVPELITEGGTGFMYPVGHAQALVRAILRLQEAPEKLLLVRRAARELVGARFLLHHHSEHAVKWLEMLLEEEPRSRRAQPEPVDADLPQGSARASWWTKRRP